MKFELDDAERAKMKAWNEKHLQEAHDNEEPYCGAAGGRVSYVITHTGLGTFLAVECGVCIRNELRDRVLAAVFDTRATSKSAISGARCNLTDFTDW